MKTIDKRQSSESNYFFLTLAQYVAAIFVIMIHCGMSGPIFPQPVNFLFLRLLCKIAVPLFFVSTGYFVRKKMIKNEEYMPLWWKRSIKNYLWWSVIYLPYGFVYIHQHFQLPVILYPVALLVGVLYLGVYYQLWYFPALFLGMKLSILEVKKLGYRVAFLLSLLFYSFGIFETYSSFLEETGVYQLFSGYMKIFFTPRNGLFFSPLFLLIGFFVCDFQKSSFLVSRIKSFLLLSAVLMGMEGLILYHHQGLDTNFLISLPMFIFFFFLWLIQREAQKVPAFIDLWKLKEYATYYFFIHLIPIEFLTFFVFPKNKSWVRGLVLFFVSWFFTHLFSFFVIGWKRARKNKKK